MTNRRSPRGPTTRRRCDDLLPKSGLGVSRSVTDVRSGTACLELDPLFQPQIYLEINQYKLIIISSIHFLFQLIHPPFPETPNFSTLPPTSRFGEAERAPLGKNNVPFAQTEGRLLCQCSTFNPLSSRTWQWYRRSDPGKLRPDNDFYPKLAHFPTLSYHHGPVACHPCFCPLFAQRPDCAHHRCNQRSVHASFQHYHFFLLLSWADRSSIQCSSSSHLL